MLEPLGNSLVERINHEAESIGHEVGLGLLPSELRTIKRGLLLGSWLWKMIWGI
jgi:hypothetical protein